MAIYNLAGCVSTCWIRETREERPDTLPDSGNSQNSHARTAERTDLHTLGLHVPSKQAHAAESVKLIHRS